MTSKIFPETTAIPPTQNQSGKFLGTNGSNLLWQLTPYDNASFLRDGSISTVNTLDLTNLPQCNTFEIHFWSTTSMGHSNVSFNGDSNATYETTYSSNNGVSSTNNQALITTSSNISLSDAFTLSSVAYYIRINNAGGTGLKTAQIHWQSGNGNGLAMGSWKGTSPINRIYFSFGSSVSLTYRIVGAYV